MSVSVIIPAYKEEENLKILLPAVKSALNSAHIAHEVIVVGPLVDTDNSRKICLDYGCTYINRENGNNYGDAVRTGIRLAKNEYIMMMDADGSHDPEDIKRLHKEIISSSADIVIGSRYIKGGKTHNTLILKFMSYALNTTYRFVFEINVQDISNSFRIYNAEKLKKLNLQCNDFDVVEEILILLNSIHSAKIKEIPVEFKKRAIGNSKRNLMKFIFSYLDTMFKLYKIKTGIKKKKDK